MKKLFLFTFAFVLIACSPGAPMPTVTPIPPTQTATLSPTAIPTPVFEGAANTWFDDETGVWMAENDKGEQFILQVDGSWANTAPTSTPVAEGPGYLDELEVRFLPASKIEYKGVKLNVTVATGVVNNIVLYEKTTKVQVEKNILSKKALEVMYVVFNPAQDLNDKNLADFAQNLDKIEKGELPCDTYTASFDAYDPDTKGGKRPVVLAPNCGGVGVPEGAIEMKNVNFIYGHFEGGSDENPKGKPWFTEVFPATDHGSGLLISNEGAIDIIVGMPIYSYLGKGKVSAEVGVLTELAIDYIRALLQGKKLHMTNLFLQQSSTPLS